MLPLVLAIVILLVLILWARGKRRRRGNGVSPVVRGPRSGVSGKLRRDLIRIAGNAQVAQRLVDNLRHKHPGQSESWYWEKAIFDLERDRHY